MFLHNYFLGMKKLKVIDIEKLTLENKKIGPVIIFEERKPGRVQIGVSSLKKGEKIPWETHDYITQFVRVESGEGYVQYKGGKKKKLRNGSSFTVSSGIPHIIVCTGEHLKFYSIYTKDSSSKTWIH
jgi:quercetin dioxygenase-like cupin family protein